MPATSPTANPCVLSFNYSQHPFSHLVLDFWISEPDRASATSLVYDLSFCKYLTTSRQFDGISEVLRIYLFIYVVNIIVDIGGGLISLWAEPFLSGIQLELERSVELNRSVVCGLRFEYCVRKLVS